MVRSGESVERVMVFPAEALQQLGYFQGLDTDPDRYIAYLSDRDHYTFESRDRVEHTPSLKQVIPYVIIEHQGRVLAYRRGTTGGEQRLFGNWSIGLGGHVQDADADSADADADGGTFQGTLARARQREVSEELALDSAYTDQLIAVLNDDSDDVGRVHFGIVYLRRLADARVAAREAAIAELRFMEMDELTARIAEFENWSRICIGGLARFVAGE